MREARALSLGLAEGASGGRAASVGSTRWRGTRVVATVVTAEATRARGESQTGAGGVEAVGSGGSTLLGHSGSKAEEHGSDEGADLDHFD